MTTLLARLAKWFVLVFAWFTVSTIYREFTSGSPAVGDSPVIVIIRCIADAGVQTLNVAIKIADTVLAMILAPFVVALMFISYVVGGVVNVIFPR